MYASQQNFVWMWPSGLVFYPQGGYYPYGSFLKTNETMGYYDLEGSSVTCASEDLETVPLCKKRGAPVKFKNNLAEMYEVKNSKGKPFKFSFVCQNLMAHLQHLFGLKEKSRYNKTRWLRSYNKFGARIQTYIKKLVGRNVDTISFKRTLTMAELKMWLHGIPFKDTEPLNPNESAQLRYNVFRAFCVLKSIDIEHQYLVDFNVGSAQPNCGQIFRDYILKTLWEEMAMPEITEEEIHQIMAGANK